MFLNPQHDGGSVTGLPPTPPSASSMSSQHKDHTFMKSLSKMKNPFKKALRPSGSQSGGLNFSSGGAADDDGDSTISNDNISQHGEDGGGRAEMRNKISGSYEK